MQTDWRGGTDGSELAKKKQKKAFTTTPPIACRDSKPGQVGWPSRKPGAHHPAQLWPPFAPPLLFPGPMEGQAVPTEPCQGCALTPTIHPNPPLLHPSNCSLPSPGILPASLSPALTPPRPGHPLLSPRQAGVGPGPSRAQSSG